MEEDSDMEMDTEEEYMAKLAAAQAQAQARRRAQGADDGAGPSGGEIHLLACVGESVKDTQICSRTECMHACMHARLHGLLWRPHLLRRSHLSTPSCNFNLRFSVHMVPWPTASASLIACMQLRGRHFLVGWTVLMMMLGRASAATGPPAQLQLPPSTCRTSMRSVSFATFLHI